MAVNWKKLVRRIPFQVQLGNNNYYEVVWVEDFPDGDTYGETRYGQKQIAIKKNLSPKLTVTTYLHEVIHGMSYVHGVALTETQVRDCEKALYFFLKDANIFRKLR